MGIGRSSGLLLARSCAGNVPESGAGPCCVRAQVQQSCPLGRCPLLTCPTHRCERGPSAAVSHCHTVTAPSTSQIQGRNARRMPRRDSTAVPWARVSGFPAFPLQSDPHLSRKLLDCHCRAAATEIRLGISRHSNFFSFF